VLRCHPEGAKRLKDLGRMNKKLIIIVVVLLILVIALWAFVFFSLPSVDEEERPLPSGIEEQDVTGIDEAIIEERLDATPDDIDIVEFDDSFIEDASLETEEPSDDEVELSFLTNISRVFVEDYTSYSSSSGYLLVESLYGDMTPSHRHTERETHRH